MERLLDEYGISLILYQRAVSIWALSDTPVDCTYRR